MLKVNTNIITLTISIELVVFFCNKSIEQKSIYLLYIDNLILIVSRACSIMKSSTSKNDKRTCKGGKLT